MSYLSSGQFKTDLIHIFGPLEKRKETKPDDTQFDQFSEGLARDLTTLNSLWRVFELPELSGLRWSDFYSIVESNEIEEEEFEELLEEYDEEEQQEIKALLTNSLEIFNNQGNPFFTVCDAGVCMAFEGPWEISVCHDDFSQFVNFLVQLTGASLGKINLSEIGKHLLKNSKHSKEGHLLIKRSLPLKHFPKSNSSVDTYDSRALVFIHGKPF